MFHEKNEAVAKLVRQRPWLVAVSFTVGALAMLLIVYGH